MSSSMLKAKRSKKYSYKSEPNIQIKNKEKRKS